MKNLLLAMCLLLTNMAFSQDIAYVDSVLDKLDVDDTSKVHQAVEMVNLSKRLGYVKGEARALHKLGYLYYNMDSFGLAITKYNQSLKLRKKTGEVELQSMLLVNIAYVFHYLKDYDKEIHYANESLKLAATDTIKAFAYLSLAKAYAGKHKTQEAVVYLKKGIDCKIKINDPTIWSDYLEVGNTMLKMSMYDSAISYYWKMDAYSGGDPNILAKMYVAIGTSFHYKKMTDQAEIYYTRSVSYRNKKALGCAFLNLAELNYQMGHQLTAEAYLDSAVKYPFTLNHYANTLIAMNKKDRAIIALKDLVDVTVKDYEQILPYHSAAVDAEYKEFYREQVEANKALYESERRVKFFVILTSILILGLAGRYLYICRYKIKEMRAVFTKIKERFASLN